jgi:ubiquinone/menaquinone biosynthesis C-methylase UbiE
MTQSVNFDRAAGFYDDTRDFPAGEEVRIAELIATAGNLSADSRVLEIGVGTGRIALPLVKHTGEMHGADISHLMLKRLCEKRIDEDVYPVVADAGCLPYADDSFDIVLIVNVLHLITELEPVNAEMVRVLRPGGRLLRCYPVHDDRFRQMYHVWHNATTPKTVASWLSTPDFLVENGWRVISDGHVHRFGRKRVPQQLIENNKNRVWSSTWNLSDEQIERGVAALQTHIDEHYDDASVAIDVEDAFHVVVYEVIDGTQYQIV